MQAIILLGGKGTRLQGLYPDRPKALVPIAGRPFLQCQLEWLARHGIRDAHLAAGYKAQVVRDWASTAMQGGAITVSAEPHPLGTGGGLKYVEPFIRTDPFLILNGDSFLPNLDFQALVDNGQTPGTLITLAITRIESAGRYGTVEFDARKRVTAFREASRGDKLRGNLLRRSSLGYAGRVFAEPCDLSGEALAKTEASTAIPADSNLRRQGYGGQESKGFLAKKGETAAHTGGWINGGVYLAHQALLNHIETDKNLSLETDIFPALCAGDQLRVFPAEPPLLDMGTPDGIQAMERYLRNPATHLA
ncbi:MAG: NTP transferase domain-containing protein [Verrucomicrobia bacterium]|nr:NTP transferase domain-containing protein [Verrucomicrobiota bacterium]MBU1735119.1 NTP transferase domain-containing protein [Verrucomicrobiota bacterium]MBU1856365.1 NTP transferase domain-containing protein [Verrucomicrobiota bacterium]